MNIRAITQNIKNNRILPVYLLVGEERFIQDEFVAILKEALFPEGAEDFQVESFVAGEADPQRILESALTLPFFAQHKLVLAKEFEAYKTEEQNSFLPLLESPSPSSFVVLMARHVPSQSKLVKFAEQAGMLVRCDEVQERQVDAWVLHFAKKRGKKIHSDAVFFIKQAIGTDLYQLDNAVEKASLHAGSAEEIGLDDVEPVVGVTRQHVIFDLTDAIAAREQGRALQLLHALQSEGEPDLVIFSLVLRQMRLLLMTASLLAKGVSREEMLRRLKVPPFVLQKLTQALQGRGEEDLAALLPHLFEAEVNLKGSSIPPALVLENLVHILTSS